MIRLESSPIFAPREFGARPNAPRHTRQVVAVGPEHPTAVPADDRAGTCA